MSEGVCGLTNQPASQTIQKPDQKQKQKRKKKEKKRRRWGKQGAIY